MQNPLKGSRCYLGGPIERAMEKLNWRVGPTDTLNLLGVDVFDPTLDVKQQWASELYLARENKDYETMAKIAKSFMYKDLTEINKCDFLVTYLPNNVPTCGTHHEIIYANSQKKPTLIMCPQGKSEVSAWYFGFIKHQYMFGRWEDLYAYLVEVQNGRHTEDKRWGYLYGLI